MPGVRPIARAVMDGDYRDTVSHEKVAAMLRGAGGLPRWSKLEPVVRVLATWNTPRLDVDAQAARVQRLWYAAQTGPGAAAPATADPQPDQATAPDPEPSATAADGDPAEYDPAEDDLVSVVSAEVAVRARAERRAESERGYRGGVKFARDLPTWRLLEELAAADFDVATWISLKKDLWGRIAAGLDPHATQLPDWAVTAASYLGTLADPISYDQFSFTPTAEYVTGFGDGLRAVLDAAQSEPLRPDGATSVAAPRQRPAGDTPSHRAADHLGRLLRGHGGLGLDDIEHAGQALLQRLRDGFEHATVRDRLPADASLAVEWFQASGGCNYGDRPYRLINWHYHGLKVTVTMGRPEPVRAESTPIPGISRARDAEHALIVIDANRPAAPPLLLGIGELHPALSTHAESLIDEWVEQCLTRC